jgi:hypothetical protein
MGRIIRKVKERIDMNRIDLTRFSTIQSLLRSRWPQFLLRAITLAGFIFTILAGIIGSIVGSHNFAIIFVWIAWWSALKLFFIPFGGRSWCSICPIPIPGEWAQNGGVFQPDGKGFGLNKRWPKKLRGNWLQAGGFLLIGLFGAVTLTSARLTAIILLSIIALAFILSLIYERRSFCNYLCPIGGFTGLYAQAGPVEVRVKDKQICVDHTEKTCYTACPWGQYPLALKSSANCGLCMECLRVCPSDNIAVNLRPWGSDLGQKTTHHISETFLGLIMLASVLIDSAVFLGPWGELKTAAYEIGSLPWLIFAVSFLFISLGLLPAFFAASVWAARRFDSRKYSFRKALSNYGQILVPLGLMAWVAFTISFALVKSSYILPVISDPFGWGWNLIGMSGTSQVGESTAVSLLMQIVLLSIGLFWASRIAQKITSTIKQAIPLIVFSGIFNLGMLWLLIG